MADTLKAPGDVIIPNLPYVLYVKGADDLPLYITAQSGGGIKGEPNPPSPAQTWMFIPKAPGSSDSAADAAFYVYNIPLAQYVHSNDDDSLTMGTEATDGAAIVSYNTSPSGWVTLTREPIDDPAKAWQVDEKSKVLEVAVRAVSLNWQQFYPLPGDGEARAAAASA